MKCRVWRRNMFDLPLWETSILLDGSEGQWKWKGIPLRAERWSQNCAIKFQYRSRRISRRIHHNLLQLHWGRFTLLQVKKTWESEHPVTHQIGFIGSVKIPEDATLAPRCATDPPQILCFSHIQNIFPCVAVSNWSVCGIFVLSSSEWI